MALCKDESVKNWEVRVRREAQNSGMGCSKGQLLAELLPPHLESVWVGDHEPFPGELSLHRSPYSSSPSLSFLSGDCIPSPCHNGGTCLEEKEGFRCLCLPGYGGDLCDVGECVEGQGGRLKDWTVTPIS